MQLGLALVLGVCLWQGVARTCFAGPLHAPSQCWNVPSARSSKNFRFGVPLPSKALGISANRGQHFPGQNVLSSTRTWLALPLLWAKGPQLTMGASHRLCLWALTWRKLPIRSAAACGRAWLAWQSWTGRSGVPSGQGRATPSVLLGLPLGLGTMGILTWIPRSSREGHAQPNRAAVH